MSSRIVEVETNFRFVEGSKEIPVCASMRYDPADPYAVHILFHMETAGSEPVSWSFARELLFTGLDEHAGAGDVRLWPWPGHRGFIALALSSPDGSALMKAPRNALVRFLRRSFEAVQRGREGDKLDIGLAIGRLLNGR